MKGFEAVKPSEHGEQEALFEWALKVRQQHPVLDLMYAIPNGGYRGKVAGVRLRMEGVKAGIPDICLPVRRGVYGALYIEMKVGRNKTSPAQAATLQALRAVGNAAVVCYGFEAARNAILTYLAGFPLDWEVYGNE
jgi:hypothetical protein